MAPPRHRPRHRSTGLVAKIVLVAKTGLVAMLALLVGACSNDDTPSATDRADRSSSTTSTSAPDASTVADGIERSGILKQFPDIDLKRQKVGVFGRLVKLDSALKPGDRIEIYRAIFADPETVPRRQLEGDD